MLKKTCKTTGLIPGSSFHLTLLNFVLLVSQPGPQGTFARYLAPPPTHEKATVYLLLI